MQTTVANVARVEEFARRLGGAGEAEVIALALEHPGSTVLVMSAPRALSAKSSD